MVSHHDNVIITIKCIAVNTAVLQVFRFLPTKGSIPAVYFQTKQPIYLQSDVQNPTTK